MLKVLVLVMSAGLAASATQRPSRQAAEDEGSPFLDMASSFLQETLANQNGGGSGNVGGVLEIASMIGNLMNSGSDGGSKSNNGAGQILAGIGSMIAGANGGQGFDPSIIGNVIEMFSGGSDDRKKRSSGAGGGVETVLSLASTFLSSYNNANDVDEDDFEDNEIPHKENPYTTNQEGSAASQKQKFKPKPQKKKNQSGGLNGEALMSMLPMVMQAFQAFSGSEMEKTEQKHKEHSYMLPPFIEKLHVMWDQFSNSELADALYKKIGLNNVFKGFVGRDGKVDYDKLFETLQNQSFRRRWIRSGISYLADWTNFLSNPEVYQSYFATGQMMLNGFLQSQGYPKNTLFDINRPSETLSSLVDHVVDRNLKVQIKSMPYIKPAISYIKDVLKLGKSRELLQKLNTTELSDKLTDTLNLEVIEPILKIHRGYRFAIQEHDCDRFVLCEINSHDPNEQLGLGSFKSGVTKLGSYAAAWFIGEKTGTSFWTLFATINDPHNCDQKHPVDCTGFHEGEAKVTTEFAHTEL